MGNGGAGYVWVWCVYGGVGVERSTIVEAVNVIWKVSKLKRIIEV
jgi:hypothetical protein